MVVYREIRYTNGREPRWGFQIPSDEQRHKWFKLSLDPNGGDLDIGQERIFADSLAAPPAYNLEPEDLVEDYLTALRKHLEAVLQLSLPLVASSTPVEYIVTVPAMWSDLAVQRTRTCAEKAGIGAASSLQIVTEPEAAAIWALREQEHISGTFTIGDIFIVCDAGGGTVDLISYRVTKLKPILRVTEVVPGCGKKCGSTFLNRAFEALLRSKLESYASWDEDMLGDVGHSLIHPIPSLSICPDTQMLGHEAI